jgi:predicted AAA+ superfamily ATPase
MLPLGVCEASGLLANALPDETKLAKPETGFLETMENLSPKKISEPFHHWMEYGGFPEPFLRASSRFSTKWRRDYKTILLHEDLRDLSRIQDIRGMEQLLLLLGERVSSPLSINALREDLNVNHATVVNWIEALKKIYLLFSIAPWHHKIAKAIKKESKHYFYDWTLVEQKGPRFEIALAVSLLRFVCRMNECGIGDFDLHYLRNVNKQEVDFLISKNRKPMALFEAKVSEETPEKNGLYFSKMLQIPYYQIVCQGKNTKAYPNNIYVVSAERFLCLLG